MSNFLEDQIKRSKINKMNYWIFKIIQMSKLINKWKITIIIQWKNKKNKLKQIIKKKTLEQEIYTRLMKCLMNKLEYIMNKRFLKG